MAAKQVFGLLNIDKPVDYTSHDIVNIVRKGTGVKKVGHAGTLDPAATGVLILCMGAATRLSEYVMGHTKTYLATIHLGVTTATLDAVGKIIAENDAPISRDEFEAVLPDFTGHIKQIPPMYSAIKKGGEKLYEKARRGEKVEREARDVVIYRIQIEDFAYPKATVMVRCGSGTYIRSLANDIGESLKVGAHLSALRRLSSGENFTVDNAVSLEDFEAAMQDGSWQDHLMNVSLGLSQMPYIELNNQQEEWIRNGRVIKLGISNRGLVQVWTDEGLFVGIMSRQDDDDDDATADWKPKKIFNLG